MLTLMLIIYVITFLMQQIVWSKASFQVVDHIELNQIKI